MLLLTVVVGNYDSAQDELDEMEKEEKAERASTSK